MVKAFFSATAMSVNQRGALPISNQTNLEVDDVGYFELLSSNSKFRRFWFGTMVAMFGNWFNTIALFVLLLELTNSEMAVGIVLVIRMLSFSLPQVFTGMLADRYNRKTLMLVSNLVSSIGAAGFIFIDTVEYVWVLYFLVFLQSLLNALFVPAERAALPNIVSEKELLTANALDSITWSLALAFGSALGGIVTAKYSVDVAFAIDSLTYLVSFVMILTVQIPQKYEESSKEPLLKTGLKNVVDGWRYILSDKAVSRLVLPHSLWAIAGGGLVYLLILIGDEMDLENVAMGIGFLFMARGIGVGLGPYLVKLFFKNRSKWPNMIGWLVGLGGLFYVLVGLLNWNYWIVILVIISHAASGGNWVISTVLLQQRVPDEWRGRVFGTDMLLFAGAYALSTLLASIIMNQGWLLLRDTILLFGLVQVFCGVMFGIWMKYSPIDLTNRISTQLSDSKIS